METPDYSHLTAKDFDVRNQLNLKEYLTNQMFTCFQNVYEPAEDTFLLIDALELDLPELLSKKSLICLEIGPGSGIVISAVAKYLNYSNGYFAVDINPHACIATKKTSLANLVNVEIINMDLLSCFKNNSIDLLIFNPPYVPTHSEEPTNIPEQHKFYDVDAEKVYKKTDDEKMLIKSWAGGADGCEIMNKILYNLNDILSSKGVFYLLVIKENNPEIIKKNLRKMGYEAKQIIDRKIRGEHLIVLKIYKL